MCCKVMLNLVVLIKSLISGTAKSWCVSCRAHRKVVKLRYVNEEYPTRTIKRLVGRCTSCSSTTSSIVA